MRLRARHCPLCGSDDVSRVALEAHHDEGDLDAFAFSSRKLPEFMHFRMVCCPSCDLLVGT